MALPICIEIPEIPDPFGLTLPGGVQIEHINLMEVIQPALTPLVPLFDIIDTIVAVFNCIKAIPDTLGPPPDPTVLAACLPDLAEKVAKLLKLIPQLSLPLLIVGLIGARPSGPGSSCSVTREATRPSASSPVCRSGMHCVAGSRRPNSSASRSSARTRPSSCGCASASRGAVPARGAWRRC